MGGTGFERCPRPRRSHRRCRRVARSPRPVPSRFVVVRGSVASPTSVRRSRVVAHAGGDSSDVVTPWWHSLPVVHILVFSPETEDEAVYTTSRRDGDTAANSFVAFEDLRDATRASVAVSDQLDGCEIAPPWTAWTRG